MTEKNLKTKAGLLLGLVGLMLVSGCVVEGRDHYREGYWDRDHARYWHNNGWVACAHEDEHCR